MLRTIGSRGMDLTMDQPTQVPYSGNSKEALYFQFRDKVLTQIDWVCCELFHDVPLDPGYVASDDQRDLLEAAIMDLFNLMSQRMDQPTISQEEYMRFLVRALDVNSQKTFPETDLA